MAAKDFDELEKLNQEEDKTRAEILGDYKNNIMIEALAGAGKTTMLVDRLTEQVKTMEPSQIVAITFTEKAADELKGRFQKRLLEEYEKAAPEERAKLQKAVDQINDIQISTIHSFCNKLLKEMTFEAGLGLDFEVVQDADEERAIRDFFERFCRDNAQKQNRERLIRVDINAERLYSTFKSMCYKRDVDEWVYDKALAADPNGLNALLKEVQSQKLLQTIYESLKNTKTETDKKGNTTVIAGFTDDEIDALGTGGAMKAVLKPVAADIAKYVRKNKNVINVKAFNLLAAIKTDSKGKTASKICASRDDKDKETGKSRFDATMLEKSKASNKEISGKSIDGEIDLALERWSNYRHALCMELLVKAYEAYQKERVSGGRISNDELLVKTRDMLRNSKKARDFFRNAYRYFYIDEYQDTDPIQTEILTLLTATENTIGKEPKDVDFLDGHFCLIGDPKQSIYAFRGADVVLYSRMRKAIVSKKNCKLYQMNRNHRSNQEICDWVNKTFKKAGSGFGFESTKEAATNNSTQAGFDNMLSAKPAGDCAKYIKGVYKYNISEGGTKLKKEDVIRLDSQRVAQMIKNMIDTGTLLSIYDTKTGTATEKKAEAGDFMIITRKKEGIRNYATELKKLGIPVLVNGASSVALGGTETDPEGSPLKGFRNLIDLSDLVAERSRSNRAYRLALVLVRVYHIDISPTEKFAFCDALYGEDAKERLEEVTDQKVKAALLELTEIIKLSRRNPLLAFERLAQSYQTILQPENTREELLSEVGALEQLLEQIRAAEYGTYADLNEELKRILDGKNEKELPMGEEESRHAVRIMNAHLAKGLEANIVILACPAYAAPAFQDKVIVTREKETDQNGKETGNETVKGYVNVTLDPMYHKYSATDLGTGAVYRTGVDAENNPVRVKLPGFEEAAEPKIRLHEEEEVRVLYVSATRPRECLIISDAVLGALPAWSLLADQAEEIPDPEKEDEAGTPKKEGGADDTKKAEELPEYQKIILEGIRYGTNVSGNAGKQQAVEKQMESFEKDRAVKEKNREALNSISELRITPSGQEGGSDKEAADQKYMRGNLYGLMMHRFFELLIGGAWNRYVSAGRKLPDEAEKISGEELVRIVRSAVAAGMDRETLTPKQCRLLLMEEANASLDETKQREALTKHVLPEFRGLAERILKDKEFRADLEASEAIYTELPFELNLDENGIKEIEADMKEGYRQGQQVHVTGIMDLVLEQKDKFVIWDYKSDVIHVGEELSAFEGRLAEKYMPQLRIYKAAIRNIAAADAVKKVKSIETKIYHRFRDTD